MDAARARLADPMDFWQGVQYLFFRQWSALKDYANRLGVRFIGDLPIYVSGDSADVWARPGQFQLDGDMRPVEVAGVPPDGFTADGQLWGNPLFDWERMEADGYAWWIQRIRWQKSFYDMLRIDHFRGFDAYYVIPPQAATARDGHWRQGPGMKLFRAVERALGKQAIIAEDLGYLTDSVRQLLRETGFPGMKVLQMAFDSRGVESDYLPHNYGRNCVCYVGTHDNETVMQWREQADRNSITFARKYLGLNAEEEFNWGVIRGGMSSVADTFVVQMQDCLGLGGESRMNTPGSLGGNWQWRLLPGEASPGLAKKLCQYARMYGRC